MNLSSSREVNSSMIIMEKSDKNQLELTEFTDPYCTWCWGSEPVLRKIREVYGEQVKISFIMGGLVRDIGEFYDPLNKIGGEGWEKQVARHWLEASEVHGMPVDEKVFYDTKGSFNSTYPANMAVKAAELQSREKAEKFLRRLREAASAERKQIHKIEVQSELAKEIILNVEKFKEDLKSGRAEKEFKKDLELCRKYGVTGFPTFLLKRGDREMLMHGYHSFEHFKKAFHELMPTIKEKELNYSEKSALEFVEKYKKTATQEIAVLFGMDKKGAFSLLKGMEKSGKLKSIKAGNDYFWIVG